MSTCHLHGYRKKIIRADHKDLTLTTRSRSRVYDYTQEAFFWSRRSRMARRSPAVRSFAPLCSL